MTSNQLRTLSHDALVDHVRTHLTGTPAASARAYTGAARSGYVGLDGVPAVCIDVYPKRRRREAAAALSRLARITNREAGLQSAAAELTYGDFFATEPARQLVAS
jgi:hypothetical protein